MGFLRVILATSLFCISTYLIYDLFAYGFSWTVLFFCIAGYLLVHFTWPKDYGIDSDWLEILEFVVDLPYRVIALALRSIGKAIRSSDNDIGIDL